MPFHYVPAKDTKNGTDTQACLENGKIISDGLRGIHCVYVGECSHGEKLDYTPFAPWGAHLSDVERYENGAKNIWVKDNITNKTIGYIIVRPLETMPS